MKVKKKDQKKISREMEKHNYTKEEKLNKGSEDMSKIPNSQRDRGDSVTSGWSVDNIPEIRISKTDSNEIIVNCELPDNNNQDHSSDKYQMSVEAIDNGSTHLTNADMVSATNAQPLNKIHDDEELGSEGEICDSIAKSIKEIHELTQAPNLQAKDIIQETSFSEIK